MTQWILIAYFSMSSWLSGPVVVDGFSTQEKCEKFHQEIKSDRYYVSGNCRPVVK